MKINSYDINIKKSYSSSFFDKDKILLCFISSEKGNIIEEIRFKEICMFDKHGNFLWQMSIPRNETNSNFWRGMDNGFKSKDYFCGLNVEGEKIIATTFWGRKFDINPSNGEASYLGVTRT